MAWTAPTTRTTGTLITAAMWNTDLVDNLAFLGGTHDHNGGSGDGATIAHASLSGAGTGSHATIDTHLAATAAHGVSGAIVGTTDSQTLSNKTLSIPTVSDFTNAQHDHASAGKGGVINPVPTGMIAMFDVACPTGWTRVSAFDGKFIRGAAAYGGTGGSDTHSHSHTHTGPSHTHTGPSHTHTGPSHTHTGPSHTHTGPSHTHESYTSGDVSYPDTPKSVYAVPSLGGTMATGDLHSGSGYSVVGNGTTAGGTGATGAAGTGATGSDATAGSTLPAYIEVVFCKKD